MALRDRTLIVDSKASGGINLTSDYGLIYSSFEEKLPEPKTISAEIPGGTDIDLTEALGVIAWKNGQHTLKFLLYGDTEEERLEKKNELIAILHGTRHDYWLSWEDWTYNGRMQLSVEHRFDNADLLTIDIDRTPWKRSEVIYREVYYRGANGATYVVAITIRGGKRYEDVKVKMLEDGTVNNVSYEASSDYQTVYDYLDDNKLYLQFKLNDWLFYVDGTNMVVKASKLTISGNDAALSSTYTIDGTDIVFDDELKQHIWLSYVKVSV